MKSITKIGGITVATMLTLTVVSMSLMDSAEAQRDRQQNNQDARQNCTAQDVLIGACVGGVNANVQADVSCSVAVLSSQCDRD
jgi:hypothetical protein